MRKKSVLLVLCVFIMGAGPCDLLEPPLDTDTVEADTSTDTEDCEPPCIDELRVDVVRSDNQAFADGAYDFNIFTPKHGEIVIRCWLWTSMVEQPLECTYSGLVTPRLALEDSGTAFALALPVAPLTSTWVVLYSGGEVGRKDLAPQYEPQEQSGCAADCVEADEVMAVEIW
ncbi:MAG: hypothetical protein MUC50_20305 [Myxococcota bacterium]|jgi:hypothetical protein|nr:hypothetical protein [Myxococcota bacterium]